MKKYIAIFYLLISINPIYAQMPTKTILQQFNLKGKVKTVTYICEKENHKLYFDQNGNLIKQESIFPSIGDISGEIYDNYEYEDGKLKSFEIIRTFKSRVPLFIEKALFEYDSLGLLIHSDSRGRTESYKYDNNGNRIERYGYLKTKQKYNENGQVIEEWAFEDKETTVRKFHNTDAQGNPLPDVEYIQEPYELPPNKYEYNEFGDVIRITNMKWSPPYSDAITLKYDHAGNWIERTANDHSSYNLYQTTEQIFTAIFYYGKQYIQRIIEYYE
jgi:YD repeat-containing protein